MDRLWKKEKRTGLAALPLALSRPLSNGVARRAV